MKSLTPAPQRSRRGVSLLEVLVAASSFAVVAWALVMGATTMRGSHTAVMRGASRNRELRASVQQLERELRASRDDVITITKVPNTNDQLDFQVSLEVAGAPTWGAEFLDPNQTPPLQPMAGWSVRYSVQEAVVGGSIRRSLVRQILDVADVVQDETTVATGLRAGTDDPRGFEIVQNGDLLIVTLSFEGWTTGAGQRTAEFHVSTRN